MPVAIFGCLGLAAAMIAGCGVFFLSYNALGPFEMGENPPGLLVYGFDEIIRPAGTTVRYVDGWAVTVSRPEEVPSSVVARREGFATIAIGVRFTNGTDEERSGGIGSCGSLFVNGKYRHAHFERPEIRALSDVDGPLFRLAPGSESTGTLVFEVPTAQGTRLELDCDRKGYKTARFVLT